MSVAFIDTEIALHGKMVLDIGAIRDEGRQYHDPSIEGFMRFIKGSKYICGHNILRHDLKYIDTTITEAGIDEMHIIDTLLLSPLLFPKNPYHALVKDDKLQTGELNNPLSDAKKARDLFYDEVDAFKRLDANLQQIYYGLLAGTKEFVGFFKYLGFGSGQAADPVVISSHIKKMFTGKICSGADLAQMIASFPVALAYCLALIHVQDRYSITPPWVLKNYPEVNRVMHLLRSKPCITSCAYCDHTWDIHKGLKRLFGYESFRSYDGKPLQQTAVKAAVDNKSLLAVFPTGGGKSITFQLPALMGGEAVKGLTVVISPLQSLMKDQLDNLEQHNITDGVMINGLLDPIARAKSLKRIEDGSASILYISPESLRSRTMERLLLNRKIIRFVIDEAHCFSAWGQDFRIDYTYIGPFIKHLQQKKGLEDQIPVSCFSATAKRNVIEDIKDYFKIQLGIDMEVYTASASRPNLHYEVIPVETDVQRYQKLRALVMDANCPTIVYVSRTRKANDLAAMLLEDGIHAKAYHGKMQVQEKTENQNAFLEGAVDVMVATSAFGMGVDKKDVGLVIHYEISDSLENYVQEAGRAGRDEGLNANCYVLYNEEDLSQHLLLLNQTKLTIKEIQQVWKAIKDLTRFRSTVSNSALEIARKAGWEENVRDIETRVSTAIASLENAGFLTRGQNMPRIFASSIQTRTAQQAIDTIEKSTRFDPKQKEDATRIIKKLFSSRSRQQTGEEVAESRIDYISDDLGIAKEVVIHIVHLLREEKILADNRDLTAFIKRADRQNRSLAILETYGKIEQFLLSLLSSTDVVEHFHIKELNGAAEQFGCSEVSPAKIRTLLNFWVIQHWVKRKSAASSPHNLSILLLQPKEVLREKMEKRHELAKFITGFLYKRLEAESPVASAGNMEVLIEFSIHELKSAYQTAGHLFERDISVTDIEDALFYLSKIEAIKIEGGFMVTYNGLTIERLEKDNKKRFTSQDYQSLHNFYENRVQQIHIVGAYAAKMVEDYKGALQFTEDYFQLNYDSFLRKYFPGSKAGELNRKITQAKFKQLFGELSPAQLNIIKDHKTKYIVVAAGPGSGKTRILVHKMAALLLMEDVKHEQLLMLTFSRAAATELKKRLVALVGNAAVYIDIKTFHAYGFDLLGKVGNLSEAKKVIALATQKIKSGEVEASQITKTVMVIDEAQDMDENEYQLISALIEQNEGMRVILVGDDDQSIYGFRGASAAYMEEFAGRQGAKKYELIENYRSVPSLVAFTNQFAESIQHRLKQTPILSARPGNGQGKIKLVHYMSPYLVTALVQEIKRTELAGTTCVLTKTNDEALQITGQLLMAGLPAKLIQTNSWFKLEMMAEVHYFLDALNLNVDTVIIDEDQWQEAKRRLKTKFQRSTKLDLCQQLIHDFEQINPKKKYKTDFKVFLEESRLEDFYSASGQTIYVSTIHKAKGKEFDHVFLLLQDLQIRTDDDRRDLYVGMTRAKTSLSIHLNSDYLDDISVTDLERIEDSRDYLPTKDILVPLNMKQIYLNHFKGVQWQIEQLVSGDPLKVVAGGCLNAKGIRVLQFSREFAQFVQQQEIKGYILKKAEVNFTLYWQDMENGKDYKIILPNLYFERKPDTNPFDQFLPSSINNT